ncbi:MAG: SMP-30/gluconolactonase/LRE family protein [Kiritimatiellia bacterium]
MKTMIAVSMMAATAMAGVIQMPETCTTPDGMTIDPQGRLVIAAPNCNGNPGRKVVGAVFRLDAPGGRPYKWFDVAPLAASGYSQPMGVCFGPEGELYVCDCQKAGLGRLLRYTFKDDKVASCETIAEGLYNANGVKYLNGRLYLTQAFLNGGTRGDGAATSGLYMFNATDRNVRVGNTPADPQCVFADVTRNRKIKVGLNGVAIDSKGNIYTGNYGDGRVWRLTPGADGRIEKAVEFVHQEAGVVTPDGFCMDAEDNLYIADMFGDQSVKVSPEGKVTVLKKGCFVRPSEPCVWRGNVYIANYGATTLDESPLK